MTGTAIVAIPRQDDYVWNISSEKIPHLTLLMLGDLSASPNLGKIVDFVEHVAETSLTRFGLDVDHRGLLGPDDSDVLFFADRWGLKDIALARAYMLKNDLVRKAYDSVAQFPQWTPHLTLGTPSSPAKPDKRDWPGTSFVSFDKIAVWTGDFEGPTFDLKDNDWNMDMAMNDVIDGILSHHGIKGQKWGVRRKNPSVSSDAARAEKISTKAKTKGRASLTNKELKDLTQRMSLDQQLDKLNAKHTTKYTRGKKFIGEALAAGVTLNSIIAFSKSPAGQAIKQQLVK